MSKKTELSSLENYDEDERQALRDLLASDEEVLGSMFEPDYDEPPVSLDQFVDDDYYMGRAMDDGLFPYWREVLHKIENHTGCVVVLTGAKRTGKSSVVDLHMARQLEHVIKMKNPHKLLGAQLAVSPIVFTFFSLSERLVQAESYGIFNQMLLMSPFFCDHCTVRGKLNKIIVPPKRIQFSLGSPFIRGKGILGKNIVSGLLDEISELSDVDEFKKQKAFNIFLEVIERMIGTFVIRGRQFGKLFLVSTSDRPTAFIEAYIDKVRDDPNVLIFEPALWDVKPAGTYSKKTFFVAVGNKYLDSKLLGPGDSPAEYEKNGYTIITPPEDFRHPFMLDPDGASRRLAGISTSSSRSTKLIPSKECIQAAIEPNRRHPFTLETVILGTKDNNVLERFFLPDLIPYDVSLPRALHVDIGLTGHALGMAMAHASADTMVQRATVEGKMHTVTAPTIRLDFALRVKNPPQDEIALWKICDFIVALQRTYGFNLARISFDGYQSRHGKQILEREGLTVELVSVHKTDAAYLSVRGALIEQRMLYYDYPPLLNELEGLEHDRGTDRKAGKVYPPTNGSDDVSDGLAGVCDYLEEADVAMSSQASLLDTYKGMRKKKRGKGGKRQTAADTVRDMMLGKI